MSDVKFLKVSILKDADTGGQTSTILEPSVCNNGSQLLVTGNWFACRSVDNGGKWEFMNPEIYFDHIDDGFCCDQTVIYDKSHDLTFWLLQYGFKDGQNTLRLTVKHGKTLINDDWDIWDFTPRGVNPAWKTHWFDYNHAALSNNYLYIGTNVYDAQDIFVSSIILRIPLKMLAEGKALNFDLFKTSEIFSLRCVQGAKDKMYFAAHTDSGLFRIYTWPEKSMNITQTTLKIGPTSGGDYVAKCKDGSNFMSRGDSRVTGAWVVGNELGFLWTSNKIGTERPFPFIRALRVNAKTMKMIDEPDIWHPEYAYAYPDAAPNAAGEVGITCFRGGGTNFPTNLVGFFDRPTNTWKLKSVRKGTNGPKDNKWGDYLTIRPLAPDNKNWIAVGYTLQGGRTLDFIEQHVVQFAKI